MKHKTYDSDSEETEPAGSVASAPAEKKCKTDGGAVASGTRRTTRSQIPCLSTETIAKVSSFANHGDDLRCHHHPSTKYKCDHTSQTDYCCKQQNPPRVVRRCDDRN